MDGPNKGIYLFHRYGDVPDDGLDSLAPMVTASMGCE